jgi:glycosyltransferase involved in cell wall biosynthesis
MISIILPTLGSRPNELKRLFESLENQDYKNFEVVIISQDNHDAIKELLTEYNFRSNHIPITKKGLSLARNEGMKFAKGNMITFSDDDCWYPEDTLGYISNYFNNNESDIVCFQIYDPNSKQYYKNYSSSHQEEVKGRSLFQKSSIEIFISTKNIAVTDIKFDENFGLGAKYQSGEENIFLSDMKKKKLKIEYVPKIVVYHQKPEMKTRLNYKSFVSKGPLFKRIYNTPYALLLLTLFFIKKFRHLEHPFKLLKDSLIETLIYKR